MYQLGALLLVAALSLVSGQTFTSVGFIDILHPGNINSYRHPDAVDLQQTFSILVNTFEEGDPYDEAYFIEFPGEQMADLSVVQPIILSNKLHYPKEIIQVPEATFEYPALSIADGVITNGVTSGTVYVVDITNLDFPATTDIVDPFRTEYFMYTDMEWMYVDGQIGDPLMDILTCRVRLDGGELLAAQLIWLEHPVLPAIWSDGLLKDSACDSYLARNTFYLTINNEDFEVVYTTGFYTYKLAYFWSIDIFDRWNDPDDIFGEILEMERQYLDVEVTDLNTDGIPDLLVTVVANTGGSLEAWEVPADFRDNNQYVNWVLATGFDARTDDEGRAPGLVSVFHPTSDENDKPFILLTGGDDGRVYYLEPDSDNPTDWDYTVITISDVGAGQRVVGATAVDADGNGYKEIYVGYHDLNQIEVFSFSP